MPFVQYFIFFLSEFEHAFDESTYVVNDLLRINIVDSISRVFIHFVPSSLVIDYQYIFTACCYPGTRNLTVLVMYLLICDEFFRRNFNGYFC